MERSCEIISILFFNSHDEKHGEVLMDLLKTASIFECMVAFAKSSFFLNKKVGFLRALKKALENGCQARMAIGLNFFTTDPEVLFALFEIQKKYKNFSLYVGSGEKVFHPKIYAIKNNNGRVIIVGSANMTYGGLFSSEEVSIIVRDIEQKSMNKVFEYFNFLLCEGILVQSSMKILEDYADRHCIYDSYHKLAKVKYEDTLVNKLPSNYPVLAEILQLMKSDKSSFGFVEQIALRKRNRKFARRKICEIAVCSKKSDFLKLYEELLELFHSSGHQRGKTKIYENSEKFCIALKYMLKALKNPANEAFDVFRQHCMQIDRAGINLITEILHAMDDKKYPIMNAKAISGMRVAGIVDYRLGLLKKDVDGSVYGAYFAHAEKIRSELGLADFTELDALFNYAYSSQINDSL